jgi:heme/copper-type cytochrome/quinol oxidase subunit 1
MPSGSDILGGIVVPGQFFNIVAPIRKRFQDHFCPICGTKVITEDQRAEFKAQEEWKSLLVLSPTGRYIIAATLIAFFLVMVMSGYHNRPGIRDIDRHAWNQMSVKQQHRLCAKLAAASSKGDSEQQYYEALTRAYNGPKANDLAPPGDAIVKEMDPGNQMLPQNQQH